jgi:cytochrome c-type biogenesis protein CcmH/NrfF
LKKRRSNAFSMLKWTGALAGAAYFTYLSVTLAEVHAEEDTETQILKSLYCQCGCGRIAYDCLAMDCSLVRDNWKPRIEGELAAGKTKDQIINGFVEEYGEKVLVKPSKPLELPIWIWSIPIASLVGAVGIYQYVRRRHRVRG